MQVDTRRKRQFAARLRSAMKDETSIAAFCRRTGHDYRRVTAWRSGENLPEPVTLAQLARDLDVSVDWLLGVE